VADLDGAVGGFLALGTETVEHLYVRPDLQGTGIGSALLDVAKDLRPAGFRLWVFQRNVEARRFYERRGLRLVELTDGAANEEREPDALYEWRPLSPAGPGRPSPRDAP
jgi:GNAT superfamily N-acetyltransferase